MNYTNEELAYLAGLLDGEGCIHICDKMVRPRKSRGVRKSWRPFNRNINYSCAVSIANTNTEVLYWIKERFGGSVFSRNKPEKIYWDTKKSWHMSMKNMAELLQKLLPYLIIKKKQAVYMILARSIIDSNILRQERSQIQKDTLQFCADQIKLLNQKNPSALSPFTLLGLPSQLLEIYPRLHCQACRTV